MISIYVTIQISPYFLKLVTSVYRIFWVNFTQNITRVCFKHYQNVFQDIPDYLIKQKTSQKKNNLRRSQFSKKRGGVRRGMIIATQYNSKACTEQTFIVFSAAIQKLLSARLTRTVNWTGKVERGQTNRQTDRQSDSATTRPNQPSGPIR